MKSYNHRATNGSDPDVVCRDCLVSQHVCVRKVEGVVVLYPLSVTDRVGFVETDKEFWVHGDEEPASIELESEYPPVGSRMDR